MFRQVARLREKGVAILFITHRLEEVFDIADRVRVFRDGSTSRPGRSPSTSEAIVREMVGRDLGEFFSRRPPTRSATCAVGRGLWDERRLRGVSFDVHRGEVLGFAGLVGAGAPTSDWRLFGIAPADAGEDRARRQAGRRSSRPEHGVGLGIAYLSEDRRKLGLYMPHIGGRQHHAAHPRPLHERSAASSSGLRNAPTPSHAQAAGDPDAELSTPVGKLSGGNQQKVMLAKWLNTDPGC